MQTLHDVPLSPPARTRRASALKDFRWSWRGVHVRETGMDVPFNVALLRDAATWGVYFAAEATRAALRPKTGPFLAGAPALPRPWYLMWGVIKRAGFRTGAAIPDATLHFRDETRLPDPSGPAHGVQINRDCTDISKSHVAEVFERIFGYSLAVDPTTHTGLMVEKAQANGRHDGRILRGPIRPRPGAVYQRVVDNTDTDARFGAVVRDFRCPTVFGGLPLVFVKTREASRRFDNYNAHARIVEATDVFSASEIDNIRRFCAAMRLDLGGLDILRDNHDGRIYIVDVNKTDMPPLVLPLREKLRATDSLARALRDGILARMDKSRPESTMFGAASRAKTRPAR